MIMIFIFETPLAKNSELLSFELNFSNIALPRRHR